MNTVLIRHPWTLTSRICTPPTGENKDLYGLKRKDLIPEQIQRINECIDDYKA